MGVADALFRGRTEKQDIIGKLWSKKDQQWEIIVICCKLDCYNRKMAQKGSDNERRLAFSAVLNVQSQQATRNTLLSSSF